MGLSNGPPNILVNCGVGGEIVVAGGADAGRRRDAFQQAIQIARRQTAKSKSRAALTYTSY